MKKLLVLSLSVLVASGAIVSCSKTSKGKMSNDWKVDSWKSTTTNTDDDGDVSVSTVSHNGATITMTDSYTPNGGATTTSTSTATLNAHTYVISKDGTWSSEFDLTSTEEYSSFGVDFVDVTNQKMTSSGTWNFLGTVDEFKKNERVIFHTLDTKTTTTTTSTATSGGSSSTTTSTSTSSDTYADGQSSEVFIVVESKNKELQLKTEESNTSTNTSGGSTSTSTSTGGTEMTLSEM